MACSSERTVLLKYKPIQEVNAVFGRGGNERAPTERRALDCGFRTSHLIELEGNGFSMQVGLECFVDRGYPEKDFTLRENENVVLQLVSVRNVAQPCQKDEFPSKNKLMMITMSNGKRPIQCLDMNGAFNFEELAPGTKIQIKGCSVRKGIVLLEANRCKVLGGRVEALAEAWEFQKSFGKVRLNPSGENQAPSFEPFDSRKTHTRIDLGGFRTFDVLSKTEEDKNDAPEPSSSRPTMFPVGVKLSPFQNHDAVREKLLSEMPEPSSKIEGNRGRGRHRGRGRGRESSKTPFTNVPTLTLEEYEAQQKAQSIPFPRPSADRSPPLKEKASTTAAEQDLLTSMFSYGPKSEPSQGRSFHRGRGRGRRGRGRR